MNRLVQCDCGKRIDVLVDTFNDVLDPLLAIVDFKVINNTLIERLEYTYRVLR